MPLRVASLASIAYSTIIFCQGIIPAIETIVLAEIIDNLELNKVRTVFFVYIYISPGKPDIKYNINFYRLDCTNNKKTN